MYDHKKRPASQSGTVDVLHTHFQSENFEGLKFGKRGEILRERLAMENHKIGDAGKCTPKGIL